MTESISSAMPFSSKFIEVNGAKMHYVEAGAGDPIVFLHGIPTNCYLWRNLIPHLASLGRCIAVDLIGFGQSAKPDIKYTIAEQISYVEQFIQQLNLQRMTFIMHGIGSVIGLSLAMQQPKSVKALVIYEGFLHTLNQTDFALPLQEQVFDLLHAKHDGSITDDELVVRMIAQSCMRDLKSEELEHYRQPFKQSGAIKPVMQYLNELADNNHDHQLQKIIADYSKKLTTSKIPKLLLYSLPGFFTSITDIMWAKKHLPVLEVIEVGEDFHLAQESEPLRMAETISAWLQGVTL